MTAPEQENRSWVAAEPGDDTEYESDDASYDDEPNDTIEASGASRSATDVDVNGDSPAELRLRGLVNYIATSLVDHPDEVEVVSRRRGQTVHLSLSVPEEEIGKIIGRQGRIARAIRTAVLIAGSREDVRATLDIES